MDDKLKINLIINDRQYPLSVRTADEGAYREAARRINERLNMYRSKFPSLSKEDHANMAMLDFAVNQQKQEIRNDTTPYKETVDRLTKELEDYLKK